ncbi:MAG: response regulator [Desulfobacterales bacterium]|nr:MAG: response regulator [Desulfobacterales bacterium]
MARKKTILIVDDDIAHRTMLRILLEWEYEIFEADDGLTAVQCVQTQLFDIVLMDVRMIDMSGLEALERIKTIHPSLPVIMLTAYSATETVAEAFDKGAYDYLTKPFDLDELKQTIEKACAHDHP